MSELLILPDGQVLVHNLTQPFAELLAELNPDCDQITARAIARLGQVSCKPKAQTGSNDDRLEARPTL